MNLVSVPLSGLVSVNTIELSFSSEEPYVSVPLSGLVSVNPEDNPDKVSVPQVGFRPLIGVSFCKQYLTVSNGSCLYDSAFPSPYRG